jgi:hypothetical protein
MEQQYFVQKKTNLVYSVNKSIAYEKTKSHLLGEQEYCVRETHLV